MATCGASCKQNASMFVYGRQDGKPSRCDGSGGTCRCYCLTDTLSGGCTKGQKDDADYDLYRVRQGKLIHSISHLLGIVMHFQKLKGV